MRDSGCGEQGQGNQWHASRCRLHPQSSVIQLARKELNLRPASYKDAALTAELRANLRVAARESWVGGIRTHTSLIKSQVCSRYTTTQYWLWRLRFMRCRRDIGPPISCCLIAMVLLVAEATSPYVVALRIELSVTAVSGPSGQPVLDYRVVTGRAVGGRLSAFGQRLASAMFR